jgi:phosphoribosylformylglycinamidine cyclo-ligase
VLPQGLEVVLERRSWPRDPVFDWLQSIARIDSSEMYRTFNCGIGMVVILPPGQAQAALQVLTEQGEQAHLIGRVSAGSGGVVIRE